MEFLVSVDSFREVKNVRTNQETITVLWRLAVFMLYVFSVNLLIFLRKILMIRKKFVYSQQKISVVFLERNILRLTFHYIYEKASHDALSIGYLKLPQSVRWSQAMQSLMPRGC